MADKPSETQRITKYQIHLNWARGYKERGETHRSQEDYRKAIELSPDDYTAYHELTTLLFQLDNIEGAMEVCRSFLARKNDLGAPWNDLGALLHDQGNVADAVDAFQKAYALQPSDVAVRCNLAAALLDSNDEKGATALFQDVLRTNPGEARAHYLLGIEFHTEGTFYEHQKIDVGHPIVVLRRTYFSNDEKEQEWRSRIEDVSAQTLDIALPTKGWRTMLLRKGTRVILGFPGKNEFWGVVVEVIARKYDNIPLATVTNPATFKRVQRRAHVRIPSTGVLRSIAVIDEEKGNRTAILNPGEFKELDISAAGVGVATSKEIAPGALIRVELQFKTEKLSLDARVVRKIPQKKLSLLGLAFAGISEATIDRLARFIQQLQLEQRKRELDRG